MDIGIYSVLYINQTEKQLMNWGLEEVHLIAFTEAEDEELPLGGRGLLGPNGNRQSWIETWRWP